MDHRPPVSGATRLAAVIGWPVRHSLSPALHNAAFAAAGLDWTYLALPVAPGASGAAVDAMRSLGIEGLSVTMPHKTAIVAALDGCTEDATALRAVNCVFRDGDRLVGDNTDGGGFLDSLRAEGIEPAGRRVVVVGAGGAARAVIRSLADAGAADIGVLGRNPARCAAAASLAPTVGRVVDDTALGETDLVVNATPVGMGEDPNVAFAVDRVPDQATVADLIYHPRRTPTLAAAEARGLVTVGGLGMLLHQAARAFRHWTGSEPDVDAMTMGIAESL